MITLKPHQVEAVDKLRNGRVLWGGVGVGKTITALAYYYQKVLGGNLGDFSSVSEDIDLYVCTTAKKRDSLDWQGDALQLGIGMEKAFSPTGVSITVFSWNDIAKYEGVTNAFFIFDEQRVVGSGRWSKAFIKIAKANQWILLSATPGDRWEDFIPYSLPTGSSRTVRNSRGITLSILRSPSIPRWSVT